MVTHIGLFEHPAQQTYCISPTAQLDLDIICIAKNQGDVAMAS